MYAARWRHFAAVALRCEKRDLRALIDRDMSAADIKRLDAMLISRLHRYADYLTRRSDDVYEEAKSVMQATNAVRTRISAADYGIPDPNLPPIIQQALLELLEA